MKKTVLSLSLIAATAARSAPSFCMVTDTDNITAEATGAIQSK